MQLNPRLRDIKWIHNIYLPRQQCTYFLMLGLRNTLTQSYWEIPNRQGEYKKFR
ncbi:hypothetical protein C2845_PM06G27350 [Panicum miliaceum]|uniref:Uncharacterized protein n=1 Tax=Panicum miliaceum TaxID=4540 RepID=A0A3L6R4Q9_PANMI|nr:hypothetical protein C2845_PM06G27350 [Panicum miliaceum]